MEYPKVESAEDAMDRIATEILIFMILSANPGVTAAVYTVV